MWWIYCCDGTSLPDGRTCYVPGVWAENGNGTGTDTDDAPWTSTDSFTNETTDTGLSCAITPIESNSLLMITASLHYTIHGNGTFAFITDSTKVIYDNIGKQLLLNEGESTNNLEKAEAFIQTVSEDYLKR